MSIKIDNAINNFIENYEACKITNEPIVVSLDDAELILKILGKFYSEDNLNDLRDMCDRLRDNAYEIETIIDNMEIE